MYQHLIPILLLFLTIVPRICSGETVALKGGTVHPVSSDPIENAIIVFDESGILGVGAKVDVPEGATTVDCAGKHIYPSMIVANSVIGLLEIPSVRATVDTSETGSFNPNAMAHKAFNPDSEIIPVTRSNGVLLALAAPTGGLFSGQSSLMRLSGWTWEEMLVEPGVAMHVNWPRATSDSSELRRLKTLIDDAHAYRAARAAEPQGTPFDIRWEAMQPLITGKQPLTVDANSLAEIEAAVAFASAHDLKLIIRGGYDAPLCAPLLKGNDVPVIVSAVHRLPQRRSDPYDAAYTLPERLRKAGIKFCIAGDNRFASNARNLPYHAATAAAYGLPAEESLKSITLYPAQILGVADRVGSLEPGKEATLFISDGDPLETPTQILAAYAAGKPVDLNDRHKSLYEKFKQRLEEK